MDGLTSGTPVELPITGNSVVTDTEEGRAFFQERLAVFGKWVFFLSFGFWVVGAVMGLLSDDPDAAMWSHLLHPSAVLHLAASAALGGIWALARYGSLGGGGLRRLDAGGVILVCTLFALMGRAAMLEAHRLTGLAATAQPWVGLFSALLACTNTVITRAIAVPSNARRTVKISSASLLPTVVVSGYHHLAIGTPVSLTIPLVVNVATWCAVAIAVAGLGSRIIFGLRREVRQVSRLGQYTLEEKIGEGGMGMVYRASHAMLRRPTAIKLLPSDRAGEDNLWRFEREVQHTAQLSHPNTVAIYDYGRTPDDVFYYAMEYLDGITLETLVREFGPQPAERVVEILKQVCGSLSEAHELGLIHRDIKPGNIILTERGGEPDVAKVVDFGLVKSLDPAGTDLTMAATTTAVLTGTPLYLSPEAIRGKADLDARCDLYALGAVGYFLLTGHAVFGGTNLMEICGHHLHSAPVPPSERTGEPVPRALEDLLLRCLAKQPDDRPRSARALANALARCVPPGAWNRERAADWWRQYRAGERREATRPAAGQRTVQVDVKDRIASPPPVEPPADTRD